MPEAKFELQTLFQQEALKHVPFAVLGNKIDIPTACSSDELRALLEVPAPNQQWNQTADNKLNCAYRPNGGGPIEVFMVSLTAKMGYSSAFKWITEIIKQEEARKKKQGL